MASRSSDSKLQELLCQLKTDGVQALDQLMDAYEERRAQRAAAFPAFFFVPVYGVVKLGHGLIPRFLVFRARSVRRRLII